MLTGGEPTIHKDLLIITQALKDNGFPWGMETNGFNLSEESLQQLVDRGIDSITLSFDGDRESTNYIRNSHKAFDRILHSLALIGQSEIKVRDAVTCVYPGNLNKLDWISETLLEMGMYSHRLFRIYPKGGAADHSKLDMDYQQTRQMVLIFVIFTSIREKYPVT